MRALTLTAAAAVSAGLLLTGCGVLGGDGGEADPGAAEEKTQEEAAVEFTECMREAGIDMPDPGAGGEEGGIAIPGMDAEDEDVVAAMEECEELIPVDENAPSEEEVFEDDLAMAECLREHGMDIDDPEPGAGLALPVEPDDDEDMAAITTCSEERDGGDSESNGESGAEAGAEGDS